MGDANPQSGLDSLDVRGVYPSDNRHNGSATCFFKEGYNTNFNKDSNPSSRLYESSSPYAQTIDSHTAVKNIHNNPTNNDIMIADMFSNYWEGTINTNTTWAGQIFIKSNVTVSAGATLTILSGSTVTFNTGTRLTVNGSIQANGTSGSRITFTRFGSSGKSSGLWLVNSTVSSNLSYCNMSYADFGIRIEQTTGTVTVDNAILENNSMGFYATGSSPYTLQNSTIRYNQYGVYIVSNGSSNNNYIRNNTISNNNPYHGMYFYNGAFANLRKNYIYQNKVYGIRCYSNSSPDLQGPNNGYNRIYSNQNTGVIVSATSWPKPGTNIFGPPNRYGYNRIYSNTAYNVNNANTGTDSLQVERNYWSSDTTQCAQAQKLNGRINWRPILPVSCDPPSKPFVAMTPYEFELIGDYKQAIGGYEKQIAADPNSMQADFLLGGLVRCYDMLDNGSEVIELLNALILEYPNSRLAWAGKELSLSYMIRFKRYDEAIERGTELLEVFKDDKNRQYHLTFDLAMAHQYRANGKGWDLDRAKDYYQILLDKYPDSELAFLAKLELKELEGNTGLGKQVRENQGMDTALPGSYSLSQNYPNPFNPTTHIRYEIPRESYVDLRVFNLRGELVRTLVDHRQTAHLYEINWDGRNEAGNQVASGIYICQIQAGEYQKSIRLVLLR